jgi:glycerophosphoryl diester phosphodiesterase
MSDDSIHLTDLISHRFRGFSKYENTLDGLKSALDFGVLNLEFDVRMALCGTPMVYHDEYAIDKNGKRQHLSEHKAADFKKIGGDFARMPRFEALLAAVAGHKSQNARLLVDIKDAGFEEEINALISLFRLQNRTIYVSWLPEVLYKLHDIAPDVPKCLSHWCQPVNQMIRAHHKVFRSKDGTIPVKPSRYIMGVRSGWEITAPITGSMLDVLKTSNGGVCVPQNMISRDLSDYYHKHGLFVSTFSYINWENIRTHKQEFGIDMYFIDNKQVFDQLA